MKTTLHQPLFKTKRCSICSISVLLLLRLLLIHPAAFSQSSKLLPLFIEAESFQFYNGWNEIKDGGVSNRILLAGNGSGTEALTVIDINQSGTYHFWTRSRDFLTNQPRTRSFRLYVNQEPLAKESGKHGTEGYYWEKAGSKKLEAGNAVLSLKEAKVSARCDAILVTADENYDPNRFKITELAKYVITPIVQEVNTVALPSGKTIAALTENKVDTLYSIANDLLRLTFVEITMEGKKKIAAYTEMYREGRWWNTTNDKEGLQIYLQQATDPAIDLESFFPSWINSYTPKSNFTLQGKTYEYNDRSTIENPFMAAVNQPCNPIQVRPSASGNELEVIYETAGNIRLKGIWTLPATGSLLKLKLSMTASSTAYYSFIVTGSKEDNKESVKHVQLPPMFQYQRIPDFPAMVPSTLTPHPLAIIETTLGNQPLSQFIAADPDYLPMEWGTKATSPYGFSIKNLFNKVQAIAFSPILGLPNSKVKANEVLEKHFIIGSNWGSWSHTLEQISNDLFKVTDYRDQKSGSLTDAIFNMFQLLKQDTSNGWNASMKGFYDIEQDPTIAPTVVQPSPLVVISAAVLQQDECLYINKALPTIEYTLSRNGYRWSNKAFTRFKPTLKSLTLTPYNNSYNTAYFEGLYSLLSRQNPWIIDLALPNGKPIECDGYGTNIPAWTQALAAYRLTGKRVWLTTAIKGAEEFLKNDVYAVKSNIPGIEPFYNGSFYSYWWDLPDLYEITKDEKFLKAATDASFQTIAGIRSYPKVIEGDKMTIHPGNKFEGNSFFWWKANKRFRLGFPRKAGDAPEKSVSTALVSPVGLGLEQPITFYPARGTVKHILMSSWAPSLLRLYQYNPQEILNIYARNSIIGRFNNYPGYYAPGFTDIYNDKDYPYKGPDISSIYYHHIPAHLALSLDFLITSAMVRTGGHINFPWSKQDGFVWFNNRIFGGGTGQVFTDDSVKLWMDRSLISINNPEVNYITGISNKNFWVVLMNEANEPATVTTLLNEQLSIANNTVAEFFSDSTLSGNAPLKGRSITTTIKGKGYMAIRVPLNKTTEHKLAPPVKNGMREIDLGAPWGKFYGFRIRSPFGWDSFYGFLSSPPVEGAVVQLISKNKSIKTKQGSTGYPYEWSFNRLRNDQPLEFELRIKKAGAKDEIIIPIAFEVE